MRKHSKGVIQPKIMSRKGLLAPEGVVATDMTAIHGLNALWDGWCAQSFIRGLDNNR